MNKYLFLFLSFFGIASTSGYAQTSSGNMMAGGGFELASSSRQGANQSDASSFSFTPSFGYFVNDNFAVGASLSFATSRTGTGDGKEVDNSFGFGPFARYYKFTSNDRFAIYGQAGLAFGTGKHDPALGNDRTTNYVSFSVFPGAAYFFNEHWALELSIPGFSLRSTDPNTDADNDKVTRVEFGLRTFSPTLGFRYHF